MVHENIFSKNEYDLDPFQNGSIFDMEAQPQPEEMPYVYEKLDLAKIIAENADPQALVLSGLGLDSKDMIIVADAVKSSTVKILYLLLSLFIKKNYHLLSSTKTSVIMKHKKLDQSLFP